MGQTFDLKGNHKVAKSAYEEVVKLVPRGEVSKEARDYMTFPYKRKHG